jgi:hypothetical protein
MAVNVLIDFVSTVTKRCEGFGIPGYLISFLFTLERKGNHYLFSSYPLS